MPSQLPEVMEHSKDVSMFQNGTVWGPLLRGWFIVPSNEFVRSTISPNYCNYVHQLSHLAVEMMNIAIENGQRNS